MATPEESPLQRLLARAAVELPSATWDGPGDLGRMSIESMIESRHDVRDVVSQGVVRLSGAGVSGHAADLDAVGRIATLWQRCVTAVGAALEGTKAARGRLSSSVLLGTQLSLNAAPGPGSIVLAVSPKQNPFVEIAPGGEMPLLDAPRPIADRASEELIELLSQACQVGPDGDELAAHFGELGPRAATAIKALADALNEDHFDVDVSWQEPSQPTRRASMPSGTAGWLSDFVAGRALDGVEKELSGTVRTVSDIAKWSIETAEGRIHVDASSLDADSVRATHVGEEIRLWVLLRVTQRPDGSTHETYEALDVLN
jgi:hypothetical protein